MGIEIERKFLVKNIDFIKESYDKIAITQAYICKDKTHTIRIRKGNNKAFLTIKGKSSENGLSRIEWEKEISMEDIEVLEKLCADYVIKKTRYLVRYKHHTYEVDVFENENKGLILAELELENENDYFEKPDWLGEEVTGNMKYYNSYLSTCPYSLW